LPRNFGEFSFALIHDLNKYHELSRALRGYLSKCSLRQRPE
jgi:hypothetical protein